MGGKDAEAERWLSSSLGAWDISEAFLCSLDRQIFTRLKRTNELFPAKSPLPFCSSFNPDGRGHSSSTCGLTPTSTPSSSPTSSLLFDSAASSVSRRPATTPWWTENCSGYFTCSHCLEQPGCGWCTDPSNTGKGRCMEGSSRAPMKMPAASLPSTGKPYPDPVLDASLCLTENKYNWSFIQCPGPIRSTKRRESLELRVELWSKGGGWEEEQEDESSLSLVVLVQAFHDPTRGGRGRRRNKGKGRKGCGGRFMTQLGNIISGSRERGGREGGGQGKTLRSLWVTGDYKLRMPELASSRAVPFFEVWLGNPDLIRAIAGILTQVINQAQRALHTPPFRFSDHITHLSLFPVFRSWLALELWERESTDLSFQGQYSPALGHSFNPSWSLESRASLIRSLIPGPALSVRPLCCFSRKPSAGAALRSRDMPLSESYSEGEAELLTGSRRKGKGRLGRAGER
ncbi:Attractin, partial [Ophiophagus hannah]